ncbi:(d)CMP kinase [Paralimibaculum aggregatum]|uniref:Cytidylate kinase n=1 Tax=Paralimibaculum aggregatum TaxID=3036245 RepID=A0ABQ6LP33_9RHOB|nr:d(CMP) kinase [Limibaculum sp. NKW23]GMG82176.1 (d)CMP kinase [Limibaculum sp. NKW23]
MQFTVAIDGPAGAGKGTLAKAVAARFGFAHLDTGLLYRAVGRKALDQGRGTLDEGLAELVARELTPPDLARDDLRGALASRAASKVAAMAGVRKALVAFQRDFARREGGAVLDGRDIGSVICPQAEVKLYLDASLDARARRRHEEMAAGGAAGSLDAVRREIEERDSRDASRADAPLTKPVDAHLIDTTDLTIEQAVERAVDIIEQALARVR